MAITVPKEERRVLPEVTPNVQMQVGDIPAISEIGIPPSPDFKDRVTPVAEKMINDEINRLDNAVGLDNDVQLGIEADRITNEVKNKFKGRNAVGATDEARKLWNDAIQKIGNAGVKNRSQEEAFNRSVARNTLQLEGNVANHTARETDVYKKQVFDSSLSMKVNTAIKDEKTRIATMKEIEYVIRTTGKLEGWADDYIENKIKDTNSIIITNAIREDEINGDPEGALKTYNLFQEHISEDDRIKIKERLEIFVNQRKGSRLGEEIFNSNPKAGLEEMYAKVKEKTGDNERLKKAAMDEINRSRIAQKDGEETTRKNAWTKLYIEITKLRLGGKIPSQNAIDPSIIRDAFDTDPKLLGEYIAAWDRERTSAKSEREKKLAQEARFREIVGDIDNWPTDKEEITQKLSTEVAYGRIESKHYNQLFGMMTKRDPHTEAIAKNAYKRMNDAMGIEAKSLRDDPEKKAEFDKRWEDNKNMLNDFIANNYNKDDYEKKLKEFIDDAIEPRIGYSMGRWLDDIFSFGTPGTKAAEEEIIKKQETLREQAGKSRRGRKKEKTGDIKRQRAIEILKEKGKPITEKNINWVMERIK